MNVPVANQSRAFGMGPQVQGALAPSFERRRLRFYALQMVADIVVLLGAFAVASYAYHGTVAVRSAMLPANLMLPLFLTIALYNGTYSIESLKNWRFATNRALSALLIAALLLNFFAFFAKLNDMFSRVSFTLGLLFAGFLMSLVRQAAVDIVRNRWGPSPINVLVIDDGGPPIEMPHTFRLDAAEQALLPTLDDPHALDRFARYLRNMDQVIVSCPPERRVAWAMVLKGSGVHGEVLSDFMHEIGALGVVHRAEIDTTTLLVSSGPLGLRARAAKRLLDVGVSLAALVVVLPVLMLAALAIKLEDGGPVLFRQKRIGRGNQLFSIYKLRTMRVDGSDTDGKRSASKDDERVTRVGRFLRRSSIDELPQLYNVLTGDMSLVGPRPHAIGSLAGDKLFWEVDQRYWQRHSLRPGLTGLAQVRGFRGATAREADLSSRLRADLEYLSGWTIWRDITILLATARVLIHDRAF